jgi:hypothetical protein
MKLEAKKILHYLPHGLNVIIVRNRNYKRGSIHKMSYQLLHDYTLRPNVFTPILHPMSDCENFIEINGERVIPNERIKCLNPNFYYSCGYIYERRNELTLKYMEYESYPYWLIELFSQWHIDFQNLIGQGLAIDINTLTKKV